MTIPPHLTPHPLTQTTRTHTRRNTATALDEELHQTITRHPAGKHIPPADPPPSRNP